MGAEPYWYFEKLDGDVETTLQALRKREFEAGRYHPVIPFPNFPIGPDSPSPGAQHASIDDAITDAAEEGTRSILDLHFVSDHPEHCAVTLVPADVLQRRYGTTKPTREMVEYNRRSLESIDRGHGIFIMLYKDGQPDEIFFAGYSFD